MSDWLNNYVIEALTLGIRGAAERQRAIAQNIANLNTPGYKRWEVQFGEALRAIVEGHEAAGTASEDTAGPVWKRDTSTSARPDGNNVDLEAELALMADNQLYHRGLIRLLSGQFNRLRTVISGGGE